MAANEKIQEWWTRALLGEQMSAHPVFGQAIAIEVDGPVLTLTGEVATSRDAEDIEREALKLREVERVINHLTVLHEGRPYHYQTVIALFPDSESAKVACQTVAWQFEEGPDAHLLQTQEEARDWLVARAAGAEVPVSSIEPFVQAVREGKALLVERLPEDDAFRLISALEGTHPETLQTLPPEPDSYERT